jgi:FAD/FMN-containing dehydrogenase
MFASIQAQDPRFSTLKRSRNLRWPVSASDSPHSIDVCETTADVVAALQQAIDAGKRPTVRSGGHCYEDFVVNNPGGALLDLSLLKAAPQPADNDRYRISAGTQLGAAYLELYKRFGVTMPGGSCYTVGAGGHICGGGYGVLSRLFGLTVDWLSAVEIVTVDPYGKAQLRRVDKTHDPLLFRACRGGGGGNFGIITSYIFDALPKAPQEVVSGGISFNWNTMTESRFVDIVLKFGDYLQTRGKDEDTWGMFAALDLEHSSSGGFGIGLQFCNPDGTCKDLSVATEFLDRFQDCNPTPRHSLPKNGHTVTPITSPQVPCPGQHALSRHNWLDATVNGAGGDNGSRAKYKSCYMRQNFTVSEAKCIFKHMKRTIPGVNLRGSMLAVDSYGGAVNRPALLAETARPQRASIMKLQFQSYWQNPADDAGRLQWMSDFYTDLYTGENVPAAYSGTPYPGDYYEGCYINYPDKDMLKYAFWPELYYGTGDIYPLLQDVKQQYDPHNIFHHAMSIRPRQEEG